MAQQNDLKRVAVSVPLIPKARALVENLREDTGLPVTEAMVRLLEWFTSLDRKLRVAILTRDKKDQDALLVEGFHAMLANRNLVNDLETEERVAMLKELVASVTRDLAALRNVAKATKPKHG